MDHYDTIIVGAGSAGCVLANRLTERPGQRVLLLEAGGNADRALVQLAFGFVFMLGRPRYDWCFELGPEPGLHCRTMPYPRGRLIGGSSSINAMLYVRGLRRDYDSWAAEGLTGWSWADFEPYLLKMEDYEGASPAARGRHGPTKVTRVPNFHPVSERILAAAAASVGRSEDYNGAEPSGLGQAQISYRDGRRSGAAAAYFDPARRRPGLDWRTSAHVQAIRFDGRRAVGVSYRRGNVAQEARAARIVLCAGAVGSPHLLELSGVGDAERLRELGIAIVHHLPMVGENLADHCLAFIVQKLRGTRTLGGELRGWRGAVNLASYLLSRGGFLNGIPTQVTGHAEVDVEGMPVGLQLFGLPLAFTHDPRRRTVVQYPGSAMMLGASVSQPHSRGSVHARSADPGDMPTIVANLLTDERDVAAIVAGLRLCREIVGQPALAGIRAAEIAPGEDLREDGALAAYARATAAPVYHPAGTCRMAARSTDGVVDAGLKAHGLESLYIVDASVMPSLPSANTHAPTVMIAEKAADLLM